MHDLLSFPHIAIQCHDDPDADAIAAGYALHAFFSAQGKAVTLFYGGRNPISKPNTVKMLDMFAIPLEYHSTTQTWPGLLLTVDCQYGAGNVSPMSAQTIAVIDHHIEELPPPPLHDIRPFLGSCSSLVWSLMHDAAFFDGSAAQLPLLTALHYGLYMDTSGFSEVRHPLDRDLRDIPELNDRALKILKNTNLSRKDLAVAAAAMHNCSFIPHGQIALVAVEPCDPNVLGLISDLVMQVEDVDVAVVYSEVSGGIKYSVRTVMRENKASEIAAWLAADGLGSGGGHAEKAGGWISGHNFAAREGSANVADYFRSRLLEYHDAYAIMDCSMPAWNIAIPAAGAARLYARKPRTLAYIPCAEIFSNRPVLHIRMLEGDISVPAGADTYLMIGLRGELYPISRQTFEKNYVPLPGLPEFQQDYAPVVLDKNSGERAPLARVARLCQSRGNGNVFARRLEQGLKLFTRWDTDSYIKGEPGDWLVWPEHDPTDRYIVTAAIFPDLYEPSNGFSTPEMAQPPHSLPKKPLKEMACGASKLHIGPESALPGYIDGLPADAHTIRARKKSVRVQVRFAQTSGTLETLEGRVPYARGDALVQGQLGEVWPVRPARFAASYAPAPPIGMGEDGEYEALPVEVDALQTSEPFRVRLESGGELHGAPGDWLIRYDDLSYGIVSRSLFSSLYELITN